MGWDSTQTVNMLANRSTTVINSNELNRDLADTLLRYTTGGLYTEAELSALFSIASETNLLSQVELIFIDKYVHYLWCVCTKEFEKLDSDASMATQTETIRRLWNELIYPSNLAEIQILRSESIDSLRLMLATLVRVFIDIPRLLDWLVQEVLKVELSSCDDKNDAVKFFYAMPSYGLLEECNLLVSKVLPVKIDEYVVRNWSKVYKKPVIPEVERWTKHTLIPQISEILTEEKHTNNHYLVSEIVNMAIVALGRLRIGELFDIVENMFTNGIEDLSKALIIDKNLRKLVVDSYIEQCGRRLLNGAVDTVDIISMYQKTIHAFSVLDPQGILLQKVSSKIKPTLQERPDTCARLAEGLFGVSTSPLAYLADELEPAARTQNRKMALDSYREWVPDPIDTPVDFVRKQTNDTVSTLIDLYDNKEVFVQQLTALFGQELLNLSPDDTKSYELLEYKFKLLAQRFGPTHMANIKVMMEDVRESREFALKLHQEKPELSNVSALILSRLYWPASLRKPRHDESFKMPMKFRTMIDYYTSSYEQIPNMHTIDLDWLYDLGRVDIQLELEDRTVDLLVQPDQAVLIGYFESNESLSLSELQVATGFEEPQLLGILQFWIDHQVLGTDGEKYKVLETMAEVEAQSSAQAQIVIQDSEMGTKPAADPFEDMHSYWSYIVGMLTNLETLTLDRIHSFLVMFVPTEDPYLKTKQELESYLLAMVDEGKLVCDDGKYSLKK